MELFSKIKDCVSRCDDDNICLIISGHSQGGAIATAASLELSALTTYYEVITFAAPPALTLHPSECAPHMDFDRHYRFGKGLYKDLESGGGASGLVFDKVPFLGPDPIPGFESFSGVGEFIILSSEDPNNVAYVGFNTEKVFNPWDHVPFPLGDAHSHYVAPGDKYSGTGYYNIVKKISDSSGKFPVPVGGFANGMHCGRGEHAVDLCASDRCDRANGEGHPTCKRKLGEGERCNHSNDCASDVIRKVVTL